MSHLPNPTALRVFVEAAQRSSFTAAARANNLTQAAVSKQIAGLEQCIGSKLFDRHPRSVRLNSAGECYLPYAKSVLAMLEAGQSDAVSVAFRENLTIAIDHEFLDFVLGPRLDNLRQLIPGVDLRFAPEVGRTIPPTSDLAITFGHPADARYDSEKLCDFDAFAVGSPNLIAESTNPLSDLLLLHDVDTYWWNSILAAEGIQRRDQGVIMGTGAAAIRAAIAGVGIAVGDSLLCLDALRSGALVKIGDTSLPGMVDYWISSRRDTPKTPAMATFRHWMLQEIQKLSPK